MRRSDESFSILPSLYAVCHSQEDKIKIPLLSNGWAQIYSCAEVGFFKSDCLVSCCIIHYGVEERYCESLHHMNLKGIPLGECRHHKASGIYRFRRALRCKIMYLCRFLAVKFISWDHQPSRLSVNSVFSYTDFNPLPKEYKWHLWSCWSFWISKVTRTWRHCPANQSISWQAEQEASNKIDRFFLKLLIGLYSISLVSPSLLPQTKYSPLTNPEEKKSPRTWAKKRNIATSIHDLQRPWGVGHSQHPVV